MQNIRLIVLDVDGVLTDGGIYVHDNGQETKRFYVRDGLAIGLAESVGLRVAVISGRASRSVGLRLSDLRVEHVLQGCRDKVAGLREVCQRIGIEPTEAAYLGDDLIDLPAMLACGYPMAVADAVWEVRQRARYITQAHGGHGAVRDAIEHLLRSQGKWEEVLKRYAT